MLGLQINNYRILRKLGEGGMGAVYEAFNEAIDRRVAIKVLHDSFSSQPDIARRFLNEARAANLIGHPGIVSVSDVGQLPNGASYIVMEYLPGDSLRTRLRRGPMPLEAVLRISRQIASALSAAHARRIVHRDLKPDNLMLVADPDMPGGERVKVLDFGLAKLQEERRRPGATHFNTRAGSMMGTPHYMAPEQCRGAEKVDDRSDVYALGIMLFEMLSGKLPFRATLPESIIAMHMYEPPPELADETPGLPVELTALVSRMMLKDSTKRPSMAHVTQALGALWQSIGGPPLLSQPAAPDPYDDTAAFDASALAAMGLTVASEDGEKDAVLPAFAGPSSPRPPLGARVDRGSFPHPGSVPPAGSLASAEAWVIPAPSPPRGPRLVLFAALLVLLGGTAWIGWRRTSGKPVQKAAHRSGPAAVLTAPAGRAPVPARMVTCRLRSEPAGAQVLRAVDQTPLGSTPWEAERTPDQGNWSLLVRKPGYRDRAVNLDPMGDCQASVALLSAAQAQDPHPGNRSLPAHRKTKDPAVKATAPHKEEKKYEPREMD